MFHDIVVPLDGSSFAERALGLAERIASEDRARIHLIRVLRSYEPAEEDRAGRAAAERYLEAFVAELRASVPEVCVAVLDGAPALAIADYADRVNADLVVMTTHGRTGDERRRFGSVAGVVAHHARCTVMLVRAIEDAGDRRSAQIEHILIAVNGTESREDVETVALRLGTLGHAAFRILHTLPSVEAPEPAAKANAETHFGYVRPERAKAEANASLIAGRLRAAGLRAEVLIDRAQSLSDTILAVARQDAADLIVLMPAVGTAPAR